MKGETTLCRRNVLDRPRLGSASDRGSEAWLPKEEMGEWDSSSFSTAVLCMAPLTEDLYQGIQRTSKLKEQNSVLQWTGDLGYTTLR